MKSFCWSLVLLLFAASANAGESADKLAACLVSSTTEEDRVELLRWMFVAFTRHPAIKPISDVTDEQVAESNETVANLLVELLTGSCYPEARDTVQYESVETFGMAFGGLFSLAGNELMTNPDVAYAMSGFERRLDIDELRRLLNTE